MGFVEQAFDPSSIENKTFLNQLVDEEIFSEVDFAFANSFEGSENFRFFCAFLMAASRLGHLCLQVNDERISPSLNLLGLSSEHERRLLQGSKEGRESQGLVWDEDRCYLPKNWEYESQIIASVLDFSSPSPLFDDDQFENILQNESALLPKQKEAIRAVHSSALTLMCGGPGTGKTFTAAIMLDILACSLKVNNSFRVALAAPTGKAALHLRSKINLESEKVQIESGTIHSLFSSYKDSFYDFILIDEASMVDVFWMGEILKKVKKGSRLCLMGDPDQLPPVEAGSIFQDLTSVLKKVVLDKAIRFESEELFNFSKALKEADFKTVHQLLAEKIPIHEWNLEDYSSQRRIIDKAEHYFPGPSAQRPEPEEMFNELYKFRILCALRRGRVGVEHLNEQLLQKILSKGNPGDWFSIPILITQNNPKQDLYNGQAGVLITQGRSLRGTIYFEDGRSFSSYQVPSYQFGYCLSVHKSQGSEFDKVLLILPEASIGLGKELLYTAATRAKKELEIVGKKETLDKILEWKSKRESGVRKRLKKKAD